MVLNEIELEEQLKEVGNRLLDPPSSIDELLNMLDNLECLLINVEQAPSRSMQDALLPPMKALISNALLRNSDADVKVSVVSCISEITRITAPDAPYDDEHMKEIFQLTVAAFEKLSHVSSRCYSKAVSILETVSKVRSCLVMLDLELDEVIIKMFKHFLKIIRPNHPHAVFLAMETVMTLIIDESEDISVDLLTPILASVRKENQSASPIAWKLGEKVITACSAKLKPCLKEAVHSKGLALDEYAPIVASICQDESLALEHDHVNGSGDHLGLSPVTAPGEVLQAVDGIPRSTSSNGNASTRDADILNNNSSKIEELCSHIQHTENTDAQGNTEVEVKLEMEPGTASRKRGWRPNSLMNPEEGYDHFSWIPVGRKTAKIPRERKPCDKEIHLSSEDPVKKKVILPSAFATELKELTPETDSVLGASSPSQSQSQPVGSHSKRGRPKKNASSVNQDDDCGSLKLSKVEVSNTGEKAPTEDEVNLGKQSEGISNSEVKQQKRSRKIRVATKTTKKDGFLSEVEEKPLRQSTKMGVMNINKDNSLVHTDSRRRSSVITISDEDAAEASNVKKTKSSDKEETYEEEILKTNLKKKRTPRKEVPPETPELDEKLVGSKIKVWWPLDKMFYEGVVASYDPIKKRHKVLYADGDEERLNLRHQRWELIEDNIFPNKEEAADIPKVDSSSDKPQEEKRKVKSESAKRLKVDLKRSGATSFSKRRATASGRKSTGGTTEDERSVADKATDSTSRPNSDAEGDGQESIGKLIRSPRACKNSKKTALETVSPFSNGSPKGENESCCAAIPEEEYSKQSNRNEQETEQQ